MKPGRLLLSSALLITMAMPSLAMNHPRRGPTSPKTFTKRSKSAKPAGQRAIDDSRATQIQTALIKSGYLSGEASGHWDTQTETAMQKFQSDNGWQTKLIPDSRAIIKLGLGPSQSTETSGSGGSSVIAAPESTSMSGFSQQ
jgi:peptidoglycan hydrolase-like protein with peptidoglycan-binding domain